jgi:PelA/Pel-15E family pectate lyase
LRTLRADWLVGIAATVLLFACGPNSSAAGPGETAVPAAKSKPEPASPRKWPRFDTSGFRDGAHHWRKIRNKSRVIQAIADQPVYSPDEVPQIVANILLFQRANGGWPQDYDMLAILTDEQRKAVRATRDRVDTSFDNHNVHSQVDYLARGYSAGGEESWRQACVRGLDFMLAAQLANGGFPQSYPKAKGYALDVTFNDGVTMGILTVCEDIAEGLPQWAWLDAARRQRARDAVARGTECILKCQIRVGDRLTGWCQQHDPVTFAAAPARTFELASICPQDSAEVVQFLMRFPQPSPRIVASVDAAVEWLRAVRLSGIRVEKVPAAVVDFPLHTADFDVVVVPDPKAPPTWARHYEIGTNRPIFAGRDAVTRYALADIERERRTGTPWYGRWPTRLIKRDYPRWKRNLAIPPGQNKPATQSPNTQN